MSGGIFSTTDFQVIHVNERCRRKEERSKQGQTNNMAKQHNTPKAVIFQLPRVGLEPTTLCTLDRALYQLSWLGPNLTSHSALEEQANMYMSIYMYM